MSSLAVVAALVCAAVPALGVGWLIALVASRLTPRVAAATARATPERRHRTFVALAMAPSILALAVFSAALLPPLVSLFVPSLDHCLEHDDHHFHLCFRHIPAALTSGLAQGLALGSVVAGSVALLRASVRARRRARAWRSLLLTSRYEPGLGAHVVALATPLAFTAGLWRPRVFVSQALVHDSDPETLAIVLAHEHAHARRRDVLVAELTAWGLGLFARRARVRLQAELALSAERAADECAARASGDRLAVAAAIIHLAQHAAVAPPLGFARASFGAGNIDARVAALMAPPAAATGRALAWGVVGATTVGMLAAAGPLHHLIESLVGRFVP
jgi:Zn-dependent protease with chaperone function